MDLGGKTSIRLDCISLRLYAQSISYIHNLLAFSLRYGNF